METGLVATVADIDLQHLKLAAADRRETNLVEQGERVVHRQPRFTQLAMKQATASSQQKWPQRQIAVRNLFDSAR
jgi:hypothetical protein